LAKAFFVVLNNLIPDILNLNRALSLSVTLVLLSSLLAATA